MLGFDIYVLDVHSHRLYGEQRVYDSRGINVGAPREWRPPPGLTEHEHVRFLTHVLKVDDGLDTAGLRRVLPGWRHVLPPVNLLLTRERLLERRPRQIHPSDWRYLAPRYNLSTAMNYRFPLCGMHPQLKKRVACTGDDQR